MSISTLESRESARMLDTMAALDDSYQLALSDFTERTEEAFRSAFSGELTFVEFLSYSAIGQMPKVKDQPTRDAILEALEYTAPQEALLAVLRDSQCPKVTELKKAIVSGYIERNGKEIAEWRAEV